MISGDAQVILTLCSDLCADSDAIPLTLSEWKKLAKILRGKGLTPAVLLEMSRQEMIYELDCNTIEAERLLGLMERRGMLLLELSRYSKMGINVVTRADAEYPLRLKRKMSSGCPPLFYYAGDIRLLMKRGVGFVGSRTVGREDIEFESRMVEQAVKSRYAIISGGAKGADSVAEKMALMHQGKVMEFLPGGMLTKLCRREAKSAVHNGDLLLLSTVSPTASFSTAQAMNRNKYIYMQADATVVVKSLGKSGTWSGAMDALRHSYGSVLCWGNASYTENLELIKNGATRIDERSDIIGLIKEGDSKASQKQMNLFDRISEKKNTKKGLDPMEMLRVL